MNDHLNLSDYNYIQNSGVNSKNNGRKKVVGFDSEQVESKVPQYHTNMFISNVSPEVLREQILAKYARGRSIRDIQESLSHAYKRDLSEEFITQVTEDITAEAKAWQTRPLDKIYPIIFLCCTPVKSREEHRIVNRGVLLVIGITMKGQKELLGIWITPSDDAKCSRGIVMELKSRGVKDIFIACVDEVKDFPAAIESVFPQTQIQVVLSLINNSLEYVIWKDRNNVRKDLKAIYTSATERHAMSALNAFEKKWNSKYFIISQTWRKNWVHVIPFFDHPEEIRKVVYTINPIELFKRSLLKVIDVKGVFPDDTSILNICYLASANIVKKRIMPKHLWKAALSEFAVKFANRINFDKYPPMGM